MPREYVIAPAAAPVTAHCRILTDQPGLQCPLCALPLQPGVGHACYRRSQVLPPAQKTKARKVRR